MDIWCRVQYRSFDINKRLNEVILVYFERVLIEDKIFRDGLFHYFAEAYALDQ